MSTSPNTSPSADWRSSEPAPTPFWQRMPKIFMLPLDRPVLIRMAAQSAVLVVSPLALLFGFVGLLVAALVLISVLAIGAQFGFTIIERSSQGFLRPRDYPVVDESSSLTRPFKYVAINVAFWLIIGLLFMVTSGSEFVVMLGWLLLFNVAMPAVVMRLVMTSSFFQALSPSAVIDVMGRIGIKPYLWLVVSVFLAEACRTYGLSAVAGMGGVGTAAMGAAGGKPSFGVGIFVLLFLLSFAFWYFTYVICSLIGYAMYQFADALDITVVGPGEARASSGRRVDVKARARDALIAKMVASGDVKEAIDVLNDDLRERPHDLSLHARLHKLLLAEGYRPRIDDHTDKYLNLLMKTGNEREALPLVEEALARDQAWQPRTIEHIAPLARAAMGSGKPQLAAQLIRGFDKKHKMHPDVPHIYLIGAQLMLQSGGPALEQARRILEFLVQKFPDHPAAIEGQRTIERMDRLAAPATLRV